jgi:diphthamide biosynthesis protein 2
MSAEPSAFSTAEENAITRTINVTPDTAADQLPPEEFDNYYDIQRTSEEIVQGNYKRVCLDSKAGSPVPSLPSQIALQFPDELLCHSVPIYRRLKSKIGPARDLYVLADTSYGRQVSLTLTYIA